jgi:hypothetical protein
MRKDIVRKGANKDIGKASRGEIEVLEPTQNMSPFISFHYSYKEISSVNGQTQIRSKEKRFVNGKLESEEFEGTLGGHVYDRMVSDMQRHFFNQMEALLKPFSMFLLFERVGMGKGKSGPDGLEREKRQTEGKVADPGGRGKVIERVATLATGRDHICNPYGFPSKRNLGSDLVPSRFWEADHNDRGAEEPGRGYPSCR